MVVGVELMITLLVTLACVPLSANEGLAMSVLLGSLLFVVPNAYFTLYAFRYRGAKWAHYIARSFYWGQAGKTALTIMAFALVFRFYPAVNSVALFCAYGLLMFIHLFVANHLSQFVLTSVDHKHTHPH